MARTNIPIQSLGANGSSLDEISWTAGDAANDHEFVNDGRTTLLVKNGSGSAIDVTISAVADPYGRTTNLVMNVNANSEGASGFLKPILFNQSGGLVYVGITDDTSLYFAAVKFVLD